VCVLINLVYFAATSNELASAHEVGPSDVNMEERITSMSLFERLVVKRLDNFAHDQRTHHDFYVTRFQSLDEYIEVVQNKLFELQYGQED